MQALMPPPPPPPPPLSPSPSPSPSPLAAEQGEGGVGGAARHGCWVTLEEGLAPHADVIVICNDALQQLACATATAATCGDAQVPRDAHGSEPPSKRHRAAAAAVAVGGGVDGDPADEPLSPPAYRACVHRVACAAEPRLSLSWELRVGGEAARASAPCAWWRAVVQQAAALVCDDGASDAGMSSLPESAPRAWSSLK